MGLEDRDWYKDDFNRRMGKSKPQKPLKADWDDVPDYIRHERKSGSFGKLIIAGLVGTGITLGAMKIAGIQFSLLGRPNAIQQEAPVEYESASNFPKTINPVSKSSEQMFWEMTEKRKAREAQQALEAQQRQTDFNDNNYTPKAAANIIDTSEMRQIAASSQKSVISPQRTQRQTRTVEQGGSWVDMWGGGGRYYAQWTVVNNRIDGTTVCSNHGRGSIDYREGRKSAKQYFKKECRTWEEKYERSRDAASDRIKDRYCSAASSFSPMG